MEHTIENYLRRMDIDKLYMVCQKPEKEILPEIKAMALEILVERLKTKE